MKGYQSVQLRYLALMLVMALFLSCSCPFKMAAAADVRDTLLGAETFAAVRGRWMELLTGGVYDAEDKTAQAMIQSRDASAEYHWRRMNKSGDRDSLFPDLDCGARTANMTATYNILEDMAIAYQTRGGRLYRNIQLKADLLSALDFMNVTFYNERTSHFSPNLQGADNNWWDWEVGTPKHLNNIVVLLYDELSSVQIESYMRAVRFFVPDPETYYYNTDRSTGANRVSGALVCAIHGLNAEDSGRISAARDALSEVFLYVTDGDGFYADGSFVQHGVIAYTGGYGLGLISDLSELLYLLRGTPWEVKDPAVSHVYTWMYQSFEPFVNSGMMMDPVAGRQIARAYNKGYTAMALIQTAVMLSLSAPERMAADFRSMAKTWTLSETAQRQWREWKQLPTLFVWERMCALKSDDSVALWKNKSEYRQFSAMDRPIVRREDYTFAVSMSSSRIAAYEALYGENDQGWHTGDGMTYLYNADDTAYADAFWPTVDRYRLPGTTTCGKPHQAAEGAGKRTSEAQVGGVELDHQYGAACMQMNTFDGIAAKKSWFMFGGEIVALGADISSTDSDFLAETIVENRKLTEGNVFTAQGQPFPVGVWPETEQPLSWAHLGGQTPAAEIGYYFPEEERLHIKRERRNGVWAANQPVQAEYLTMWKEHAPEPEKGDYAYVLLPGISMKETAEYAAAPKIEVVDNTPSVQSVRQTEKGLTGVIFWTDSQMKSAGISCNRKAAVMIRETADEVTVSVADPTQLNTGVIELELDQAMESVAFQDTRIKVTQLEPSVKLQVDVSGALGASAAVTFHKIGSGMRRLIDLDHEILLSKAESGWQVSDHGTLQLRRWSAGLEAETGGVNPSGFERLILKQSTRSWYKDHLLLSVDQAYDLKHPLVAEMTYRLSPGDIQTAGEVQAAVRIRGNNGYAEYECPVEVTTDSGWKTLKLVLDPARGRLICVDQGRVTVKPLKPPAQPLDDLRLYLVTDPDGTGADGTAPLVTPVIWEIESLKLSEVTSDLEPVLENITVEKQERGDVLVSATVRNADLIPHEGTFYAGLFDCGNQTLLDCRAVDLIEIESGESRVVSATLKGAGVHHGELEARLFVWEGGAMRPVCRDAAVPVR